MGLENEFTLFAPPTDAAPLFKQQQWGGFSEKKKNKLRKKHRDQDHDGVPDIWDCQPRNPFMQDRYSETQLAEIKGMGQIEAGDFIGKGGFGAVYSVKAKDPAKQHIADKFVIKVGIDAHNYRRQGLKDKDRKLMKVWETTEGHKPSLERLFRNRGYDKWENMEAIREYKDYKDKGFEDLSMMVPVKPMMADMGEFRTFSMLKPKLDVIGERFNRLENTDKITPDIVEQMRTGTNEFTQENLEIWDFYQVGVGEQDGEMRVWAFDTDIVRDAYNKESAANSNERAWDSFVNAVRNEKGSNFPFIQQSLESPVMDEDSEDLEGLAMQLDISEGWHGWDIKEQGPEILDFTKQQKFKTNAGKTTYVILHLKIKKVENASGKEYHLSITHGRQTHFVAVYSKPAYAVKFAHKVARALSLMQSAQSSEDINELAENIMKANKALGLLDSTKKSKQANDSPLRRPLHKIDEDLEVEYGWPAWNEGAVEEDYFHIFTRRIIVIDGKRTEAQINMVVVWDDAGQAYSVILSHKSGEVFRTQYKSAEKAMHVAFRIVTSLHRTKAELTDKDILRLAKNAANGRVQVPNAPALSSGGKGAKKAQKATHPENIKDVAQKLEWEAWERTRNYKNSIIYRYRFPIAKDGGEEHTNLTLELQSVNREGRVSNSVFLYVAHNLAFRQDYYSPRETVHTAYRIAKAIADIPSKRTTMQLMEIVNRAAEESDSGFASKWDSSSDNSRHPLHLPSNSAHNLEWGDWNIDVNSERLFIVSTRVRGYAFEYVIKVEMDKSKLVISKLWPADNAEILFSDRFPNTESAINAAHAASMKYEPSASVAGTDKKMVDTVTQYLKEAHGGWVSVTGSDLDSNFLAKKKFFENGSDKGAIALWKDNDSLAIGFYDDHSHKVWRPANTDMRHDEDRMRRQFNVMYEEGSLKNAKAIVRAQHLFEEQEARDKKEQQKAPSPKQKGWKDTTPPVSDFKQFLKFRDSEGETKGWMGVQEPIPGNYMLDFVAQAEGTNMPDIIRRKGNNAMLAGRGKEARVNGLLRASNLHGLLPGEENQILMHGARMQNLRLPLGLVSGPNVLHASKQAITNGEEHAFYDVNGFRYVLIIETNKQSNGFDGYNVRMERLEPYHEYVNEHASSAEEAIKIAKKAIENHNEVV